jgi:hypothetical protein
MAVSVSISSLLDIQQQFSGNGKGKAIPVTGREGTLGCETLRLSHFI